MDCSVGVHHHRVLLKITSESHSKGHHVDDRLRSREEETDFGARHRRRRECSEFQEDLQQASSLHSGEGS